MAIEEKLLEEYYRIFREQTSSNKIDWATHKICNPDEIVKPTIPFVGKKYGETSHKILLYASAENLSKYSGNIDIDEIAVNRHRIWFDKDINSDRFYPSVHIAPINDGCLSISLKYICEKLHIETPSDPKDFLESIAFGNFGKFSIATNNRNIDYANNYKFLQYSEPYIQADIKILEPDLIVMFDSMYRIDKQFLDSLISPNKIITISQINASTINRIIHKKHAEKDILSLPESIQMWYNKLGESKSKIKNKTKKNFLSVFTYLDTRITNFTL